MEYLILALTFIFGCRDLVLSEKTIYEEVLLKKTAAALAKDNFNPYQPNRYQQRPLNPVQYVYVYPQRTTIQAKPLSLENIGSMHPTTNYNVVPQPHQGLLTRDQCVMQYNKWKSDLAHFLPAIMRTLIAHNRTPTQASTQSQVVNFVPSTVAPFQANTVLKVNPKPLPLYIMPSSSASTFNVPPSVHEGSPSSNFQNNAPVIPSRNFVRVPTIYKTPTLPYHHSPHLDITNDRDYYRRPNYDELTEMPQVNDAQTSSTQYHYQLLDGDYVISNRRSTDGKDYANTAQSQFSSNDRSKQGFESSNGYDSKTEFTKGSKGSYDNSNYQDSFGESNDDSSQNYEVSETNNDYDDQTSDSDGGQFKENLAHRKGSHTTGYHNVYHKDEYFKDHVFYDEADHSGHYRKFGKTFSGSGNEESGRAEGKYKEGDHEKDLKRQLDLYTKGYYEKDGSGKQVGNRDAAKYEDNERNQTNDRSRIS